MSVGVEVASRLRVADPRPDHCSMCFRGPSEGVEFLDCGAAFDAGAVIDNQTQAYVSGSDDLMLCMERDEKGRVVGGCVKELCEAAGVRPELHQRQLREIRRLELTAEHFQAALKRAKAEAEVWQSRYEELAAVSPQRSRGRP